MQMNIENTKEGWDSCYKRFLGNASDHKDQAIMIKASMFGEDSEGHDVLDLLYFFPLADILLENGCPQVILNVLVGGNDNIGRVMAFLSVQARRQKTRRTLFFVNDIDVVFHLGEYNDPCPSDFFSEKNEEEKYTGRFKSFLKKIKVLPDPDKRDGRIFLTALPFPKTSVQTLEDELRSNYKRPVEIRIEYKPDISRILPIICVVNTDDGEQLTYADLLQTEKPDHCKKEQLRHLYYLCDEQIKALTGKGAYIGTEKGKITEKEKTALASRMKLLLEERLIGMTLLSRMIFLYLLRELLRDKTLLKQEWIPQEEKETDLIQWDLRVDIVEACWLDAEAYADGVYQLLENSCLHSHGKRAYMGIRIYNVSKEGSVGLRIRNARKAGILYEKYGKCFELKSGNKTSNNLFNADYSHLVEFYVIDDASDFRGIVPNYNEHNADNFVESIKELMYHNPDISEMDFPRQFAEHYGLHVFRRIIQCNSGYIMVSSPRDAGTTDVYYGGWEDDRIPSIPTEKRSVYFSVYNVLLPLMDMKHESTVQDSEQLFTHPEPADAYRTVPIDISDVWQDPESVPLAADKLPYIESIKNLISNAKENTDAHTILCIPMFNISGRGVELFAKALFWYIADLLKAGRPSPKIAVCFGSTDRGTQEFIRLVSVLYQKMTPINATEPILPLMDNTQIAICEKESDGSISVKFLLTGKNLSSAFFTAQAFLYYRFENAIEYIPQLRYLTGGGTSAQTRPLNHSPVELPQQFPFDLFLNKDSFMAGDPQTRPCPARSDCLFIDEMQRVLNSDVRERSLGCKLDGLKVRFGSKLYSDSFYEAVLLFRNVGNNYRFAYLIAQDIMKIYRNETDLWHTIRNVIFVGYEAYSATLLLQVFRWLENGLPGIRRPGACILMAASHENRALSEIHPLSSRKNVTASNTMIVAVVPIGSTMSTMYKIREIVSKHYLTVSKNKSKNAFCSMLSYSILATNRCLELAKDSWDDVTNNYWEDHDPDQKLLTIKPVQRKDKGIKVKYFLSARSSWSPQRMTGKCGAGTHGTYSDDDVCLFPPDHEYEKIRPILQVDKTSTLLETIFTLNERNYKKLEETPITRIGKVYGLISYAHIYEQHNHYQFYFDNGLLFQRNRQAIANWLKGIAIDRSAFNVIVSPLDKSNVPFVKCVIDNVFSSNIRYIHIDINNSFQEDFRLKYSFLADEYRQLKQRVPSSTFNVYFVDETIVSTRTISRAELLVRMLLEESGIRLQTRVVFKNIFLLVNHSSYDTLNNYVDRPRQNVHAWINLNIPSYNTNADRCPACDLVDSYVLLRKRSSTERIGSVFDYLVDKHTKRTKAEYDVWLHHAILSKHSYFVWLKQWLFFDVTVENGDVSIWSPRYADIRISARNRAVITALKHTMEEIGDEVLEDVFKTKKPSSDDLKDPQKQKDYQDKLQQYTIQMLLERDIRIKINNQNNPLNEDDLVRIVRDYVIAKRNYMRLYCMHKAYKTLIYSDTYISKTDKNDLAAAQNAILHMICEELTIQNNGFPGNKEAYSRNAEWIISYIKILSRQHLARHYHVCYAITNIMLEMLRVMMSPNGSSNTLDELIKRLSEENGDWLPIIRTLRCVQPGNTSATLARSMDNNLCASLQYEIMMTLAHRLSVIQCDIICHEDMMKQAFTAYGHLRDKYFGVDEYAYQDPEDRMQMLRNTELPHPDDAFRRYVKSVKAATMITNNDDPCYRLAETADSMRGE